MRAIPRPELPLYRLYILRAMYAVLAIDQTYRTWSAIMRHTGPWEFWDGVGHSFFGALTVLCLFGLRYPVRMMPLLAYEVAWKLIWTLAIYLPLYLGHRVNPDTADNFLSISLGVVVVPLFLPWSYLQKLRYRTRRSLALMARDPVHPWTVLVVRRSLRPGKISHAAPTATPNLQSGEAVDAAKKCRRESLGLPGQAVKGLRIFRR